MIRGNCVAAVVAALTLAAAAGAQTLTTRVSVSSDGVQGDAPSYSGASTRAVSADGRFVAFHSLATNLVNGDTNDQSDVLVRDLEIGVTTRVSVDSAGTEGNRNSYGPSVSADGRFVAFHSYADNLVAGDTNNYLDVFVHDRQAGATTRVSVSSIGAQGNNYSYGGAISDDGRFIGFWSDANNLVSGDANAYCDVFVHDRLTGVTSLVSVDESGGPTNEASDGAVLSADGRFVAFRSVASDLVSGDTNGRGDVFVRDRQTGVTARVSVDSAGNQGDGSSWLPSISADGRFVAFGSAASNLVGDDTNGVRDVFVHDRQTGATTRVSVDSSGSEGDAESDDPSISSDGRWVVFSSVATNLVPDDGNGFRDVFVHDRETGVTVRASVGSSGSEGNESSWHPGLSGDGRFVAFWSDATNLVPDDANGDADVFLRGPFDWVLFADGFEDGTAAAWSAVEP